MSERKNYLLIVDDEDNFRFPAREHFESRGFAVLEAEDGRQALKIFDEDPLLVDLVITDIKMPRMSGEQLIPELRRRRPYLPIIGITGHDDLKGRLAILDKGAYYFLDKPLPDWPIVDRLVDNAVKLHHHEEVVNSFREKEKRIAAMVRGYILKSPLEIDDSLNGAGLQLRPEIALHPIESGKPSGDYVESFVRNDNELLFYVSDASGHDDLVSTFTSCFSNMVLHRCHHAVCPSVDELIDLIDQALDSLRKEGALDDNRYLTFFIGSIDLASGELAYVNAGHPPAFLLRAKENRAAESVRLNSTCMSVGHMSRFKVKPQAHRQQLHPGDLLFIYTDGVSDLLKGDGRDEEGFQHLEELVLPLAHEGPHAVVDHAIAHLRDRVGQGEFEDDTTVMAIKIHAHGEAGGRR